MEIERKFLIKTLPDHVFSCKSHLIEQGYLNTDPVIRIRRNENHFELTYKSKGFLSRQEYNLPLTSNAYEHLLSKIDGRLICKKRYLVPLPGGFTAEVDIFEGELSPLMLVEVEFPTEAAANSFSPPDWFGEDVTFSSQYQNSTLSQF